MRTIMITAESPAENPVATAPPPLVPADVDLRDFPFMPLDVRRLRDSKFTASVDPEAFRAGVLLWAAAWHQVPASSLPDDDVELAQLAGYGNVPKVSVREWRRVRALGALHNFVRCNDGRLYHCVEAEKALDAWSAKLENAHKRMCERVRKANKHREAEGLSALVAPSFEIWNSTGRVDPVPPEGARNSGGLPAEREQHSAGIPAETALKGQGESNEQYRGDAASPPALALVSAIPERRRGSRKANPPPLPLPDGVTDEMWAAFRESRQKAKKPLTEYAERCLITDLERLVAAGQNATAVVEQSIKRTWGGFFAVSDRDTPAPSAYGRID